MSQAKKRRRDARLKAPPSMQLTDRDKEIIEKIHLYRVLRQDQLQRLFFGSQSAAQRVLVRLYDHGFIDRRFIPVMSGRSPTYYVLDKRGAELLRADMGYDDLTWYYSSKDLSADFLEHSLAINDTRIAVTVACRRYNYELLEWKSESDIKADYDRVTLRARSGQSRSIPIVPDSFFMVHAPRGTARFFLELDRGTETLARFQTKIRAFLAYYASGSYERRYEGRSLRILTITLGQRRLMNLKEATEKVKGDHHFWFAVLSDITPETVLSEPIWYMAGEQKRQVLIAPQQS